MDDSLFPEEITASVTIVAQGNPPGWSRQSFAESSIGAPNRFQYLAVMISPPTRLLKLATLAIVLLSGQSRGEIMQFTNPILPGFHADPSLCRVGDDYF